MIAMGAGALLAALAWSRHGSDGGPAPAPSASAASGAAMRQARDALATLSKLQKAAIADNARPGYLAQHGSPAAAACLDRMHREQTMTHETLRALSKLPNNVPGLITLRQAVFQVHICVSCTPSAGDYCARAATLLDQARGELGAAP